MFEKILSSVAMVGSDLPAYKVLFNAILNMLSEQDQEKLKKSYEEALKRADEAHDRAQQL